MPRADICKFAAQIPAHGHTIYISSQRALQSLKWVKSHTEAKLANIGEVQETVRSHKRRTSLRKEAILSWQLQRLHFRSYYGRVFQAYAIATIETHRPHDTAKTVSYCTIRDCKAKKKNRQSRDTDSTVCWNFRENQNQITPPRISHSRAQILWSFAFRNLQCANAQWTEIQDQGLQIDIAIKFLFNFIQFKLNRIVEFAAARNNAQPQHDLTIFLSLYFTINSVRMPLIYKVYAEVVVDLKTTPSSWDSFLSFHFYAILWCLEMMKLLIYRAEPSSLFLWCFWNDKIVNKLYRAE